MTIIFMDTETVGLHLAPDVIWEFAAVRRESDGSETRLHLHIDHDQAAASSLPAEFRTDYDKRWRAPNSMPRSVAAKCIRDFIGTDRPHIVGAVPNFDTERLALLLADFDLTPPWHYHLIDVENLAVGYLAARGELMAPPWKSDELSRAIGVDPEKFERHTAMGDVSWVMAQYDAVMGGAR